MKALLTLLLLLSLMGFGSAQEQSKGLPSNVELPLPISPGVMLRSLHRVNENTGVFEASIDLRLAWTDPRQAFDSRQAGTDRREFLREQARAQLAKIWVPHVQLENFGDPHDLDSAVLDQELQISSKGRVEWIRMIRGEFRLNFDLSRFPCDEQKLPIHLVCLDDSLSKLVLNCDQEARNFSGAAVPQAVGWHLGRIALTGQNFARRSGVLHSDLLIEISARREPTPFLTTIYFPIVSVIMIPVLAVLLNRWRDGAFVVEAFELLSISVGGLFAAIALNFTIYSAYPYLSDGSNSVGELFALNYFVVGVSLSTIYFLFKRQGDRHPVFSPFVAKELYRFLIRALPLWVTSAIFVIGWLTFH